MNVAAQTQTIGVFIHGTADRKLIAVFKTQKIFAAEMTGVRHAIGIGAFGGRISFSKTTVLYSRESRVPIGRDLDARQGRDFFQMSVSHPVLLTPNAWRVE